MLQYLLQVFYGALGLLQPLPQNLLFGGDLRLFVLKSADFRFQPAEHTNKHFLKNAAVSHARLLTLSKRSLVLEHGGTFANANIVYTSTHSSGLYRALAASEETTPAGPPPPPVS